jgi:hypothetical protein
MKGESAQQFEAREEVSYENAGSEGDGENLK